MMAKSLIEMADCGDEVLLHHALADPQTIGDDAGFEFIETVHHEYLPTAWRKLVQRLLEHPLKVGAAPLVLLIGRDRQQIVGQRLGLIERRFAATTAIGKEIAGDAKKIGLWLFHRIILHPSEEADVGFLNQILDQIAIGDAA